MIDSSQKKEKIRLKSRVKSVDKKIRLFLCVIIHKIYLIIVERTLYARNKNTRI